jgi:Tfp pilus assembly protein PilO
MNSKFFSSFVHLTLRYPFCAVCIVVSLLLAGANLRLRFWLGDQATQLHAQAQKGDEVLKFISRGSQLRSELTAARAATQRIAENLVVEKNIPENFWYFYKIEQDTGAKLVELQQRPAPLPESGAPATYRRVPYMLKMSGPFRNVVAFLQQVETGPRLGRISGFVLQRQDLTTGRVVLQLDLEMLGFP